MESDLLSACAVQQVKPVPEIERIEHPGRSFVLRRGRSSLLMDVGGKTQMTLRSVGRENKKWQQWRGRAERNNGDLSLLGR